MNILKLLDDNLELKRTLLAELGDQARELFTDVSALELGCSILRLLHRRSNVLMTADGISGHVNAPFETVEHDLKTLAELGVVRMIHVVGVTLYGLTDNPNRQQVAADLCAWQDRWEARIKQIEQLVWGSGFDSASTTQT